MHLHVSQKERLCRRKLFHFSLCALNSKNPRTSGDFFVFYTVPLTVRVEVPGVTVQAPVVVFWVNVAAGTVICPATVANSPVAEL